MKSSRLNMCITACIFLTACGSDNSIEDTPENEVPLSGSITASTAMPIVAEVLTSLSILNRIQTFGVDPNTRISEISVANALNSEFNSAALPTNLSFMNGDCGVSGSVSVDGIIDNINGVFPPSLPDNNAALIYTNCDNGDNTSTTGELVLSSIDGFSSLRFDFNSLVSTSVLSDERISLNGDLDVNLFANAASFSTDIAIENLGVDINLEGITQTRTFTSFSIRNIEDDIGDAPFRFTTLFSGELSSSLIDGVVEIDTLQELSNVNDGEVSVENEFLRSGQLLISGTGGSSVLLTFNGPENRQLEIDTNGDGTIDETLNVSRDVLTF